MDSREAAGCLASWTVTVVIYKGGRAGLPEVFCSQPWMCGGFYILAGKWPVLGRKAQAPACVGLEFFPGT